MLIVERGGEQGVLEAEEEQMIHAVIELGEGRVHEVMVPRIAIVGLPATASLEEAIDPSSVEGAFAGAGLRGSIDEVVGILYAKDLLPFLKDPTGPRPALGPLLRPPVFVPESMSIDDLLHEFQRRKVHIAIVLDEYGGTAGLVTIEDLLEEIVGEIQDEYDVEEHDGRPRSTTTRPGSTAGPRSTTSASCASDRARPLEDATSTTRSADSSSIGSGGCPRPGDVGPRRRAHPDGRVDRRPAGPARSSPSASRATGTTPG